MTADNHQRQDEMVCLLRTEFESLLEQAACRKTRKALKEVGLADEEVTNDIRTLRDQSKPCNAPFCKPLCAEPPSVCRRSWSQLWLQKLDP